MITREVKDKCIEMKISGVTSREIYNDYFIKNAESKMSYASFKRKVNYWKKLDGIPEQILEGASLNNNLKLKWGTVHTDGQGKVIETWLRGSGEHQWQEDILEAIKSIPPIVVTPSSITPQKRLLEIPLFDMHFGPSTFEHYEKHQSEIINYVRRGYDSIVITIGSDMLHHNDMQSKTASGTPIEQLDIRKAWDDALKFYMAIIYEALKYSGNVTIYYIKGNHDESLSWAFVQTLKQIFPKAIFDDSFKERKVFTWEQIFIGYIHGDKPIKDIDRKFIVENKQAYANAEITEIHIGHLHQENLKGNIQDLSGTMVRVLSTSAKTDQWHDDNNYIGTNKRFQLFEYGPKRLCDIHYVYGEE